MRTLRKKCEHHVYVHYAHIHNVCVFGCMQALKYQSLKIPISTSKQICKCYITDVVGDVVADIL